MRTAVSTIRWFNSVSLTTMLLLSLCPHTVAVYRFVGDSLHWWVVHYTHPPGDWCVPGWPPQRGHLPDCYEHSFRHPLYQKWPWVLALFLSYDHQSFALCRWCMCGEQLTVWLPASFRSGATVAGVGKAQGQSPKVPFFGDAGLDREESEYTPL